MSELNLRQKIGQMLILGFDGKYFEQSSEIAKAIAVDNIGGVILFDINYQTKAPDKNIVSPEQVKQLNQDLQNYNLQCMQVEGQEELPLFIAIDYEGGRVTRLSENYGFPPTITPKKFATLSESLARGQAKKMALTLKETGFNLNFAPSLDVDVNLDNPIIGKLERSYSATPEIVAKYANIFHQEFLQQGIVCAYKHFPGHGSSTKDSHLDFVDVSQTWQSYELEPYKQLILKDDSCQMIMSAHIVNRQLDKSGLPATLSKTMLDGVLRQQLKFDGVIISDDMQMKAICDNYGLEQALVLAINGGIDMFIFGNQLAKQNQTAKQLIDFIEKNVESGSIALKRIDESYQRIRNFKLKTCPP